MKDGEKLQIDNWIAEKVEMDGVDFMEVRASEGIFRFMYRIDSMMYGLLDNVRKEDKPSVGVIFNNIFAVATLLDAEFQNDVVQAIGRALERVKAETVSDEEDAKILAEERAKYEMKKEMEESTQIEKEYLNDCEADFSILQGKTITNIVGMENGSKEVVIYTSDGMVYLMIHEQECCEGVYLYDVCGDVEDLKGCTILLAECVSNHGEDPEDVLIEYKDDSFTWTFYKLSTMRGDITLRWYGESNGYYSESVDFYEFKDEQEYNRIYGGN